MPTNPTLFTLCREAAHLRERSRQLVARSRATIEAAQAIQVDSRHACLQSRHLKGRGLWSGRAKV
jgi:hypothetical protein